MLLLFVFPNLSKNCLKLLNGLIAQWLNESADVVELNHIRGLDRYTFTVIILRTFRYFFFTLSFLTECKGRGLKPHNKIVFENTFSHASITSKTTAILRTFSASLLQGDTLRFSFGSAKIEMICRLPNDFQIFLNISDDFHHFCSYR